MVGKDLKLGLCHTLLQMFMAPLFQTHFREKYGLKKVALRESVIRDCLGMWLLVQSDHNSSEFLCNCVNEFLLEVQEIINQLSGDKFLGLKQELNSVLAVRSKDLDQENERLWNEICNFQFAFDRPKQSRELLKSITLSDFVGHFKDLFNSPTSKRLDLALIGKKHAKERE